MKTISAAEIRSFRAEFSKENNSGSKLEPATSIQSPLAQRQGQEGSGPPQQSPR